MCLLDYYKACNNVSSVYITANVRALFQIFIQLHTQPAKIIILLMDWWCQTTIEKRTKMKRLNFKNIFTHDFSFSFSSELSEMDTFKFFWSDEPFKKQWTSYFLLCKFKMSNRRCKATKISQFWWLFYRIYFHGIFIWYFAIHGVPPCYMARLPKCGHFEWFSRLFQIEMKVKHTINCFETQKIM